MTIWKDSNGGLWDDLGEDVSSIAGWPKGMTQLTDVQVSAARAPTLAQAQAAQISILQSSYQSAVNAPVSFKNAAGITSTYPAGNSVALNGATATANLASVIDAGSTAWTLGKWLDSNNIAQTFIFADLQGLAAAMEAVQVLDWQDLVAKVAAVQSATTAAAVQAITF